MTRVRTFSVLGTPVALLLLCGAVGCAAPVARPPDPCYGPYPPTVVHEEIEAANRLSFDPAKADALGRIAARPKLTPDEQQHLVVAAVHGLGFEPSRADVLRKLIENPGFAPPAKVCILRHLGSFAFEPTRVDLLRAMEGRGDVMPTPDAGDPTSQP